MPARPKSAQMTHSWTPLPFQLITQQAQQRSTLYSVLHHSHTPTTHQLSQSPPWVGTVHFLPLVFMRAVNTMTNSCLGCWEPVAIVETPKYIGERLRREQRERETGTARRGWQLWVSCRPAFISYKLYSHVADLHKQNKFRGNKMQPGLKISSASDRILNIQYLPNCLCQCFCMAYSNQIVCAKSSKVKICLRFNYSC